MISRSTVRLALLPLLALASCSEEPASVGASVPPVMVSVVVPSAAVLLSLSTAVGKVYSVYPMLTLTGLPSRGKS